MGKLNIFLDSDGVVANFRHAFETAAGLPLSESGYHLTYDPWGKPITEFGIDLGHDFWLNLDPYPWAQDLINLAAKFDPEYRIITSCVEIGGCASGKMEWFRKHFGLEVMRKLILVVNGSTKCPTPITRRAFLIDDREKNCEDWYKAGGIAYRWKERTADMMKESKEELTKLRGVLEEARKYT